MRGINYCYPPAPALVRAEFGSSKERSKHVTRVPTGGLAPPSFPHIYNADERIELVWWKGGTWIEPVWRKGGCAPARGKLKRQKGSSQLGPTHPGTIRTRLGTMYVHRRMLRRCPRSGSGLPLCSTLRETEVAERELTAGSDSPGDHLHMVGYHVCAPRPAPPSSPHPWQSMCRDKLSVYVTLRSRCQSGPCSVPAGNAQSMSLGFQQEGLHHHLFPAVTITWFRKKWN